MKKAIIFDFDGVIGDTYSINFEHLKMFDNNFSEQDFIDRHNGNVHEEGKLVLSPDQLSIYFNNIKNSFTKEKIFPVHDLIEELKNQYDLYIISSSSRENIEYFLNLGGLDNIFIDIDIQMFG